jgi:hypothetical protein
MPQRLADSLYAEDKHSSLFIVHEYQNINLSNSIIYVLFLPFAQILLKNTRLTMAKHSSLICVSSNDEILKKV